MDSERNFYQNLFVTKLPRNLTDGDLMTVFESYNPESAKIMLDAATGKSKGFGFVLFSSEEAGKKAYDALDRRHVTAHGHNFSLRIFPSKHDGKAATEEKSALFIRNIPKSLSYDRVMDFISQHGTLTNFSMREDHLGYNVWVVYAEYDSVQSAAASLKALHGKRFFNQSVPVIAKYADSDQLKKERRKRRELMQKDSKETVSPEAEPVPPPAMPMPESHPPPSLSHPMHHFYQPPPNPQSYGRKAMPPAYNSGFAQQGYLNVTPPPQSLPPHHADPYFDHHHLQFSSALSRPQSDSYLSDHFDNSDPFPPHTRGETPELSFGENAAASSTYSSPARTHSSSVDYRHNPYAPVTPVSSVRSSSSSSPFDCSSTSNPKRIQCQVSLSKHFNSSGYRSPLTFGDGSTQFADQSNEFLEVVQSAG